MSLESKANGCTGHTGDSMEYELEQLKCVACDGKLYYETSHDGRSAILRCGSCGQPGVAVGD